MESISRGATDDLKLYRYTLAVRVRSNAGGDLAGEAQQTTVEAALRTLADRYNGLRLLAAPLLTGGFLLVATQAQEITPDAEPGRKDINEGTLLVTFTVDDQ